MSDFPPIELGDTLRFGKFKGSSIEGLLIRERGYLRYLVEKTDIEFSVALKKMIAEEGKTALERAMDLLERAKAGSTDQGLNDDIHGFISQYA